MRNSLYHVLLSLLIAVTLFNSCEKEVSPDNTNSNKEIIAKVNSWLESQKAGIKQFKAENIELLKNNLDYSNLRIEPSDRQEQIIIVPITEKFKAERINDKSTIPNLILIIDKSGNIRKGNVVLFKPDNGTTKSKVPDNTFHDILNTGKVNSNGLFQFLSIAGQWKYQLRYKDGNLISFGLIKPKNGSNTVARQLDQTCIDWYLITTYYYTDGSTEQTSDYVGTTCSEDCGDGTYASVCSDLDGGSGGGGGNDVDYEFEAIKYPAWYVASNPVESSGEIVSYEIIKGKRVSIEPQGGHFTAITHRTSSCDFCSISNPNDVWDETLASSGITDDQHCFMAIYGTLYYEGQSSNLNNTKTWQFQDLF